MAAGGQASQTVTVEKGRKWTFSAWVRANSLSDGGARVQISGEGVTDQSVVLTGSTDTTVGGKSAGWERLYATINLTGSGTSSVTVTLMNTAASGTAYFACPQLEEGAIANPVNLLVNSDFRYPATQLVNNIRQMPTHWTAGSGITQNAVNGVITPDDLPEAVHGSSVQLLSMPSRANVYVCQDIAVSGSKDDVFVFGGWASGSSVARHGDVRFSLQMRFYVNGAWVVAKEMHYNEDVTDWQFGCAAAKAPGAYTKVRLYARYPNNGNSARFTNLFVNRDAFNESYVYNTDSAQGSETNIVASTDLNEKTANMVYDAFNNLTQYVKPGKAPG